MDVCNRSSCSPAARTCRAIVLTCGALFAAIIFVPTVRASAQAQPPEGVAFEPNLECGKAGEQALKLDLAYPAQLEKSVPCVLLIHGGAWRGGKKTTLS